MMFENARLIDDDIIWGQASLKTILLYLIPVFGRAITF
jgi:hypothetical protein